MTRNRSFFGFIVLCYGCSVNKTGPQSQRSITMGTDPLLGLSFCFFFKQNTYAILAIIIKTNNTERVSSRIIMEYDLT